MLLHRKSEVRRVSCASPDLEERLKSARAPWINQPKVLVARKPPPNKWKRRDGK